MLGAGWLVCLLAALGCRGPKAPDSDLDPRGGPPEFEIEADADIGAGAAPLTIQFTGEAFRAQGKVQWHWDFADGTVSTERSPRHTFTEPAKYEVRVEATDASGAKDFWSIQVRAFTPEEWDAAMQRGRRGTPPK
jgi:hypothetical protein